MDKVWERIFSSTAYWEICMETVVRLTIGVRADPWLKMNLVHFLPHKTLLVER